MIVKDKNICGDCPTIKGTRIPIYVVLANIKDESSFSKICNTYGITRKDIKDCIRIMQKLVIFDFRNCIIRIIIMMR